MTAEKGGGDLWYFILWIFSFKKNYYLFVFVFNILLNLNFLLWFFINHFIAIFLPTSQRCGFFILRVFWCLYFEKIIKEYLVRWQQRA